MYFNPLPPHGGRQYQIMFRCRRLLFQSTPSAWRETYDRDQLEDMDRFQSTPSAWRETAKLHRKAFFISPILVQSCKKGCKRLHSAPEKNGFFRKKGEKFGAKPPASFCAPMIRTDIFPQTSLTESAALPCLWFPLHRYVPPSTDNDFPGNKTAGCPFLYQSPVPADA